MTLAPIDWRRAWLAPYRALGEAAARDVARGASVAEALNARSVPGAPRFVAADAAGGERYEVFIARSGSVPTREDLHDFFNGLVWLAFPALERRLNALHAAHIAAHGVAATRGALGDALTLLDENGALLDAPQALVGALRARDWRALFVAQRAAWSQASLTLIGHALLAKLAEAPRKAITAHALVVAPGADALQVLAASHLEAKPFLPLPVLGVPGWWAENEDAAFYDDAAVFRR
jgi:hypothetical protein